MKCIGCENIEKSRFPIRELGDGVYLDTEHCWGDECYYKIYYCPICGEKITK